LFEKKPKITKKFKIFAKFAAFLPLPTPNQSIQSILKKYILYPT